MGNTATEILNEVRGIAGKNQKSDFCKKSLRVHLSGGLLAWQSAGVYAFYKNKNVLVYGGIGFAIGGLISGFFYKTNRHHEIFRIVSRKQAKIRIRSWIWSFRRSGIRRKPLPTSLGEK